MYPSVYTLFFTTNSPVEIFIYIYMHFFFSKSISRLFTTLFFLHYFLSDTMCNDTCGGELFFRDVHSKDEKKLHSQKRASVFCPAQVPSFGSLISFLSTTTITTYFPFFLSFSLVAVVRSFDYAIFVAVAAAAVIVNFTMSESSRVLCV